MTQRQLRITVGLGAALAVVVLAGMLIRSPRVHADDDDNESKIQIGFKIAPVPLNLTGKDRELVGLGSFLVNAVADCNGCHNPGPGNNQFANGGNPFFGEPTKINPATYLGGGRDFGPVVPGSASAHIVSRNLTPDKTGRPEGATRFRSFFRS
jgi:hypothetical protein